ncbi:MAG: hypothetical protein O3C43_19710 [Verrucomicrobia bacterium]|nr:hypothetical protein [Verrucomicrobiota bacterium]MDA1068719.1 hypothetical protein [Verrucomicrobiota bacterium]
MDGNRKPKAAMLFGVGLDNQDGHKRITSADKFAIVGGSKETHEKMTETVIKTFEDMDRKGKSLESIEPIELREILDKNTPQ